jgi:hypothetical protein
MARDRKPKPKRLRKVRVETEPQDEIDWDRYAWALLQYCRLKIQSDEKGENEP